MPIVSFSVKERDVVFTQLTECELPTATYVVFIGSF